ncbi:MAG: hypothetical protein K2H19_05855 [Ruminococcus sp.]|nr:hypothetical protein [Ruminococcus sp.]
MKNVLRKIATVITSALTVASMGVIISASAIDYTNPTDQYGNPYNPNTGDTSWSVEASSSSDYCRPKFNDSSIYVKNYSMISNVQVSVYGRKSKTGKDVSVGMSGHKTVGLTFPANNTREIYQKINENGCTFAHIVFKNTGSNRPYGVWSPDCVGSYTPLN